MNTWIFQGNPKIFNIDAYIEQNKYVRWSIRQEHFLDKVEQGDTVYIWRAEAGKKGTGGIVAKAIIINDNDFKSENRVSDYYYENHDSEYYKYVSMEIKEYRLTKDFINRDSVLQHDLLHELRILHMRNETNYLIKDNHASEIHKLWSATKKEIEFPKLQPKKRDREFKKFNEYQRDRVIFESLMKGKSNRWIDENVLGEDAEYSRGWFSMGVLHHLGLNDDHKGFFINHSIADAIKYLSDLDENLYKSIIVSLMRYSHNIYDEKSLNKFVTTNDGKKLHKTIGKSQYSDGVRIDKEFHDLFNPPNSPFYVPRGKARSVKVLFNNKIFDAQYRFEGQTDKTIELQSIRFKNDLKKEFEKVFPLPEGEFFIEQGGDLNHFIFTHRSVAVIDITDEDEESEYSEGKEYYRLHRIKERKPGVVKKAKKAFLKKYGRLYCEACQFDFTQSYGDRGNDFIEGHHIKLVSEMKDGDTTKPEDIALLCSNCHRMIHKKPLLTVEQLANLVASNKLNVKTK